MAGIGFELRKIYGKKTLSSKIFGSVYATLATIGPTVLFMLFLLLIVFTMNYLNMPEYDKMFFTSSFTYLSLTAILISSLHNTVLSRYISDKIFEHRDEDIGCALYGSLTTGTACSALCMLGLCVFLYLNGMRDLLVLTVYYLVGVFVTTAYNLLIFVSALKEYKKITLAYFVGLFLSIPMFVLLFQLTDLSLILCGYLSICLAFFSIDVFLIFCCIRAFGLPEKCSFAFLRYYRKYPALTLTGIAYMLGFYVSNMIYWAFGESPTVVYGLRTMPVYDLAMFLAIIVNLPAMVIFVVKTETEFYDKYVAYLSALAKGSYVRIEKARQSVQNTLQMQLFFVYEVQLIITILAICIVVVSAPYLMLSDASLALFAVLAMGVYCLMCMYFTIIVLYYFEEYRSTAIAASVFLAVVVAGAFLCLRFGLYYYSVPILAGSIIGWIIAFVRLRSTLKNLNTVMLCR